eukprot:m.34325 g.34325  ORF g.34325 m.34325 type:complete len:96 (+) comp6521_c1_seq1:646-933(+)
MTCPPYRHTLNLHPPHLRIHQHQQHPPQLDMTFSASTHSFILFYFTINRYISNTYIYVNCFENLLFFIIIINTISKKKKKASMMLRRMFIKSCTK